MNSFESLSERQQILHLRPLVYEVLEQYDLPVKRVSFLAHHTNFLFRVDALNGGKYVLRIYSDDDSSLAENRTEVFWLNAIQRDTDLRVAGPVARKDGQTISVISLPGLPPERRCVLFSWVPGVPLENVVTPALYFQFGEMMARLHEHSARLALPPDIRPKQWDRVFYYPGEEAVYRTQQYQHLLSPQRISLLDEAIRRCDDLLAGLYRTSGSPMLIHGDLHFGNVHVARGKLFLLDFEDTCLGYPVQDVAVTLYYGRSRTDYPALAEAFQAGYSNLQPWPVRSPQQLAGLMAARNTNFINYVLSLLPDPREMLEGMFERLEQSMAMMD